MERAFNFKPIRLAQVRFLLTLIFSLAWGAVNAQAAKEYNQANLILVGSQPINALSPSTTNVATPDQLYSNIYSLQSNLINGKPQKQNGNTITVLVADSIAFAGGTAPFNISKFYFTVANTNTVAVTARPIVQFYEADGPNGSPGTLISTFTFTTTTFPPSSVSKYYTATVQPLFTTNNRSIWAGMTFDDSYGETGATLDQMSKLGQGIYNPIDIGSSSDGAFITDAAGAFSVSNPVGKVYNVPGIKYNFGWAFYLVVPVPVILQDFQATRQGTFNQLKWTTSQESNSSYFGIERSADGKNFIEIGNVNAAGNSSLALHYQITDENPLNGINYYRLMIVDKDNSQKLSDIVSVRNWAESKMKIYPNPANNLITIELIADKTENVKIDITDMNGAKVLNGNASLLSGLNKITFNIGALPAGIYNVNVKTTSGSQSIKISKL